VTWWGAYFFARHFGFRLPTEAEWEYACKGKTDYYFPNNDLNALTDFAWYNSNCQTCDKPQPVGQKLKSALGLYDIHGNVYEWCFDRYKVDFYNEMPWPHDNPTGPDNAVLIERVIRGGSFKSNPSACRSTFRYFQKQNESANDIGFRIVRP